MLVRRPRLGVLAGFTEIVVLPLRNTGLVPCKLTEYLEELLGCLSNLQPFL